MKKRALTASVGALIFIGGCGGEGQFAAYPAQGGCHLYLLNKKTGHLSCVLMNRIIPVEPSPPQASSEPSLK